MKLHLVFAFAFFMILPKSSFAVPSGVEVAAASFSQKEQQTNETMKWEKWSVIVGALGLVFTFIPYLSLVGILMGIAAIAMGIMALKRKQRRRLAWLGIILGGLSVVSLLGVIGLMAFF